MPITLVRQILNKIFVYTLASILLIFPVFNTSYLATAQDINETIEQIERYLRRKPNNLEANIKLATAYLYKYQQTSKIRYLDLAIERTRKAVQIQSEYLPANMLLYALLSAKAMQQGDVTLFGEINQQYQAISQSSLEPAQLKNIPHPSFIAAIVYYKISVNKAGTSEEVRYQNQAINELKKAISIQPDFSSSHLLLGQIYYSQGKKDLALLEVKETIRLAPRDADNYVLLGDIYSGNIHQGKDCWDDRAITQGIQAYKEAMILAANHPNIHLRLSHLYLHRGAYNLAVQESKEAVRLHDSPQTRVALGSTLLYAGDYKQAIKEFSQVLKKEPLSAPARRYLAFAYFVQNQFELAVQEYQKYMQTVDSPSSCDLLMYHLALRHIGKHIGAETLLKSHAKNFKGEAWQLHLLNFHLGKLSESELIGKTRHKCDKSVAFFYIAHQYLLAGDKGKAREYFQKTLDTKVICYLQYIAARYQIKLLNVN